MKRKTLIIATLIFFLGLLLCLLFYFFYLKKIVIYDLVNIEFVGISPKETAAIKIYGITPVNKKYSLSRKNDTHDIPGCYKSINIDIPDALVSKIKSINVVLKEKTHIIIISDRNLKVSLENIRTYVLPPEVKSEGPFFKKLFSAYPFNVVLSLLPFVIGLLLILFCIVCVWLLKRFVARFIPNVFKLKIINLLQEKKLQYVLLSIIFIILAVWPVLFPHKIKITYFLVILLYISFVTQRILSIKKSYALYLFQVFILIFMGFEIVSGVLNTNKNKTYCYNENFYIPDTILGLRLRPNCFKQRYTKLNEKDTVFDFYYSSDEFSRRITEEGIKSDTTKDNIKKKHAVFLGCSFTFGEGLNYRSAFPFLFESMYSDFKSYNYGLPNYGPHQISLLFDEGINTINNSTIPEDSGICVYTFIYDHLNRVYGGSAYLSTAGAINSPDVYVNENKLVRKKRSNIQKYTTWLLNNSETMKYFNISITYPKTEKFYRRFAGIINYTAEKYWHIKPSGEFYVSLYPESHCVTDTSWIKYLDRKIKVLKPPTPIDFETNPDYKFKNDGHPTKELNLYYVNEFSKLIFKKE